VLKALEERLKSSKAETQKLQQQYALLDGSRQDLQTLLLARTRSCLLECWLKLSNFGIGLTDLLLQAGVLEERLKSSKAETQKLQQQYALLDGSRQDLQNQYIVH
jgi:chromosome segregation ATPase